MSLFCFHKNGRYINKLVQSAVFIVICIQSSAEAAEYTTINMSCDRASKSAMIVVSGSEIYPPQEFVDRRVLFFGSRLSSKKSSKKICLLSQSAKIEVMADEGEIPKDDWLYIRQGPSQIGEFNLGYGDLKIDIRANGNHAVSVTYCYTDAYWFAPDGPACITYPVLNGKAGPDGLPVPIEASEPSQ